MGCFFVLFAAFFPRLAVLMLWIARPVELSHAFGGAVLLPVLGIIFLPFTTLMWVLLSAPGSGVAGIDWVWIAIALAFDLAQWATTTYRQVSS